MEILKLTGDYSCDKEKITEILDAEVLNTLFLIDRNESNPICDYIQKSKLDSKYALKFRVAYEVDINFQIEIKKDDEVKIILSKINNLTELLKYFSKYIESDLGKLNIALSDYIIVLDTDDKHALSELMQQFIFLDIKAGIMLKKEELINQRIDRFGDYYSMIRDAVNKCASKVINLSISPDLISLQKEILTLLSNIEINLKDSQKKDLNICVMGTKKSGKSVVINCLIGDEYAPTSLELPTPNTCRYLPNKFQEDKYANKIVLDYNNEEIKIFDTAEQVRKYICGEFLSARKKMSGLTEMTIYYPAGNNAMASFEIIDTPGPNFGEVDSYEIASKAVKITDEEINKLINQHAKEAVKWIEKSDVVIFLMQYGNHLTNDELKFFKKIKEVFENKDKFYSLVIVVNKMDMMYMSEEYKSKIRFLDYIRGELMKIGYKGFFIMGTSALQYFYSNSVLKFEDGNSLKTDDFEDFTSNLEKLRKKYKGQNEKMTVISFLNTEIGHLNDFHSIDGVTLKTLRRYSGINEMIALTEYIALEKAPQEKFKALIIKADENFKKLQKMIGPSRSPETSKKDPNLVNLLTELKKEIKIIVTEAKKEVDSGAAAKKQ